MADQAPKVYDLEFHFKTGDPLLIYGVSTFNIVPRRGELYLTIEGKQYVIYANELRYSLVSERVTEPEPKWVEKLKAELGTVSDQ